MTCNGHSSHNDRNSLLSYPTEQGQVKLEQRLAQDQQRLPESGLLLAPVQRLTCFLCHANYPQEEDLQSCTPTVRGSPMSPLQSYIAWSLPQSYEELGQSHTEAP